MVKAVVVLSCGGGGVLFCGWFVLAKSDDDPSKKSARASLFSPKREQTKMEQILMEQILKLLLDLFERLLRRRV